MTAYIFDSVGGIESQSKGDREMTAKEFNESHFCGMPVILTNDFGEEIKTKTRSEAWEVCGSAVVKVDGITGGYDVDRIRAA